MSEIQDLRAEIAELKQERTALLEQIAGDPELSLYFYQRKADRQRYALDQLCRRNTSLRFRLRVTEQLRGPLTKGEYLKARDALQNEQLRERIDDPE